MGRFVVAVFATLIIWMMFRCPLQFTPQSALLVLSALLGCYMVIWNDVLFAIFDSDGYTYGNVARAVAFVGFLVTLVAALRGYYLLALAPEGAGIVSPFNWIFVVLGIFISFSLPLASRRVVASLPDKSVRRDFEDPR
ncbi:MAG: hypothetical protein KGJ57_20655 [Sphingomonadales bacterium]|nr:hypothetical protein [Sphingomonadales bacterium]MDE2171807.1 hypothetical protein [Sphingomonadales bacterium]